MDNVATVDIPMTPGNIKPKVVGIRRNSTGNFGIQNSEPKPIPNYLRASTDSCHDFCKYGMRRCDFQIKNEIPRRPAKTAKSTLHKTRLVKKDTEKKVPAYTKSLPVPAKHTGESKLKLLKTQTSSHKTGSNNRQNGGIKPSNSKLSRKTGVPPTASPSSVKVLSSKSRNVDIPKKVSRLENKNSNKTKKTTDYENVPEKTLYVIELKDESQRENQKTDSRAEKSRRRTRDGNGDCSPRMLEFKRGQLLDIPSESTSCRILEFRKAKTLGENQNEKADDIDANFCGVVLRPQAVGKKDTYPSLYNSVIQETASKLVQTRKSRVKALVGAFETVITLQDHKSSRTFRTL
ncbi:CaM binding domain-containing protein [Abeliophyllum distichum]|uniref:CaM binding domain-containing protein n=1 Tax=Abeliophyllum distichum TaxID=126358 RepID=A0ABD1PMT2_9LAMI